VTFTSNNLPFNAFDQSGEDGLSNFDRRQKFVASVVYSPNPFADGAAKHIFNGWTFAPILNAFSGQRFTGNIANSISPQTFGFSGSACTPNTFPAASGCPTPGGGANGSGGATRFSLVPRNFFKQPHIWYVAARLSRRFSITESTKIEFLVEGFNVFNRTQVTGVNTTIYNLVGNNLNFNPTFATTTGADSTLFRERQVQFAARFEF